MKIQLQNYNSKSNQAKSMCVNVDLSTSKESLASDNNLALVNSYGVYANERLNTNLYRFNFTVNVVASNCLHNMSTEIAWKEGSDECECLNYSDNLENILGDMYEVQGKKSSDLKSPNGQKTFMLLKDTQLTYYNDFNYRCGKDIFNNHILRSFTPKAVNSNIDSKTKVYTTKPSVFNTIEDYVRTQDGLPLKGYSSLILSANMPKVDMHLFGIDDVMSFEEALDNKLKEKNGWFGFYNNSAMNIPYRNNNGELEESHYGKVINNQENCSWVDMTPTRKDFSPIPHYNAYKGKEEANWIFYLTYPYSSTTQGLSFISETTQGLRCVKSKKSSDPSSLNGSSVFRLVSLAKNNLKNGSIINLYCDSELFVANAKVIRLFDEYTFEINKNGLEELEGELSFKEVVDSTEVKYYVRLFAKIPNWKYADTQPSDTTIYKNDMALLKKYQSKEYDFETHIGNAGFALSSYGDQIGELTFADNIDLSYLRDNLDRPLHEVFLTSIKNNKGYREWYGKNQGIDCKDENVEFSHIFGPLTCGFELTVDEASTGNSLTINNVDDNARGISLNSIRGAETPESIASDEICAYPYDGYEGDKVFYGDLCKYDTYNMVETSIQDVDYRFNTVQRELTESYQAYQHLSNAFYEEIIDDDANYGFEIQEFHLQGKHIRKEGFKYHPHTRIGLMDFDSEMYKYYPVQYNIRKIEKYEDIYEIWFADIRDITSQDMIKVYNTVNNIMYDVEYIKTLSSSKFACKIKDFPELNDLNFAEFTVLFVNKNYIAKYAQQSHDKDCAFIWRQLLPNGNGTTEAFPFLNGMLYVEKDVNLYVRRQDPFNKGGLQYEDFPFDPSSVGINENNALDIYESDELC